MRDREASAETVKVMLPSPLADYTANRREVEAAGATLDELMRDLDRRYPGLRFRVIDEQDAIRPHIKIFVNRVQAATLSMPLAPADEVLVVAALSGG
jgi:molybdopterin converting factor small subunit